MDARTRREFESLRKKVSVVADKKFSAMMKRPQGVMGEKLRELSLFLLKGKEEGKFSKKIDVKNGGVKTLKSQASLPDSTPYYDRRDISQQNWVYVTGPSDLSEYYTYGGDGFEYYPELFHVGWQLYVAAQENGVALRDNFPASMEDYEKTKSELFGESICYFEMNADFFMERLVSSIEEAYYEIWDDEELGLNRDPSVWDVYRLGWYTALAIEAELSPSIVAAYPLEEAETLFSSLYCDIGIGEIGILQYVRYFIDFLMGCMELQDCNFQKELLPVLERVYFSCLCPEEGDTLHCYVFSSVAIKQYAELKEEFPESEFVPVMDTLLEQLIDPLGFKEETIGTSLIFDSGEVYQKDFFTEKEYVCAYLFFGSKVYGSSLDDEDEADINGFHPCLKEMRGMFDTLLSMYKKECNKERRNKAS